MRDTDLKPTGVCHTCGGYGRIGGCPKCGLTPRDRPTVKALTLEIPVDTIPVTYQGKSWERPKSTEEIPLKFKDFDDKLEKVWKEFLAGRLPRFSMFIAAPPKYGKHGFAYACMQTSIAQSFSVAPLLSTSDWRRLYKVSQMNPFYKLYDKYKWDDLIAKDVVFLVVDHSDDRYDVMLLLKDILDTRAAFNKPTFIISDYKLEALVPKWGEETYTMIHNSDPSRDFNRYPVIIQRFD